MAHHSPGASAPRFTPGPWRADRRSILAGNGACIAEVFSGAAASLEEADANERLIAAAPDLFEAIADLLDQVEHAPGGTLFLTGLARRAIARVESSAK